MKRICRKCGVLKPFFDFYVDKRMKGGHKRVCIECTNTTRRPKRTTSMQTRRDQARIFVLNHWKTHPCVDCGETDPRCLTFDHIDSTEKEYNVSIMVGKGLAISKISVEVEKCEIRCANCHAKKTSDTLGFYTSDPKFVGENFKTDHIPENVSASERGFSRSPVRGYHQTT